MIRPRRRLIVGVLLLVGVLTLATVVRVGLGWKRAVDDVNSMIVPTVMLPAPTTVVEQSSDTTIVAETPSPAPTFVPEPSGSLNILLLGTDARVGEEISRTDVMIVVHVDPQANRISMLSLPRDLWVTIPGYGKNRINAAYPIGEKRVGKGAGPALAKETVSNLLNIPIDHFVLINFQGFKALIDRLNGVYIDVPKPIDDPKYPMDEYAGDVRTMKIHFDAGWQWMDGTQALIYARTRHGDSDFERNQRQQQILVAAFNRMRDQGLLTNLTSLDEYTSVLRDYIRFDIPRDELLQYATLGPHLHADDIQRYAVDSKNITVLKQPATFAANPLALHRLVDQMLGMPIAAAPGKVLEP